ncbi:DEAD/DEAH box helicase [Acanthopleuribacter pedis]|uniref:DEAD/DEAH box helicase n=1 Tax=Acanthopleuribacter pedis TaxID=442870 RepID=A0A8J7QFZ7_9BACT|nr:DEAD/DEAH box helicase [Acanthopleuribacter pedis]MBO1319751.1 DEAD/DEAH box helicase [Acanthopleuribacter pedis]
MLENRVNALAEFLKVVPESLKIHGHQFVGKFKIEDREEMIIAKTRDKSGQQLDVRFDFDPKVFSITGASCTCDYARRGSVCEHICGLAEHLVNAQMLPGTQQNTLDFLDKHLNQPAFHNAQFRLSVELEDKDTVLEPVVKIHKYIRDSTFGSGRRLTANDSYKFTQGDPSDQNLLNFIKTFRQVFFYSNYEPQQRYNWGFWLSLLNHPRVYAGEKPLSVRTATIELELRSADQRYSLLVTPDGEERPELRYFEVDGGLLGIDLERGELLVSQVDHMRRAILLEVHQYQPVMTRDELLDNVGRLEQLQGFFDIKLPDDLAGIIQKEEPFLSLLLDLQMGKGFSLGPHTGYPSASSRVLPGSPGQYLSTGKGIVVERDLPAEQELLRDFLDRFPYEEKPDRNGEIIIHDLERALALMEWLKEHEQWHIEWARTEPKIHQITQVNGLRVQVDSKAWLKIHLMADEKTFSIQHFPEDDQHLAGTQYVAVGEGEWIQIDQQLRRQLNQLKMAVHQEDQSMRLKKAALAVLAEMESLAWEGDPKWLERIEDWRGKKDETYHPSKDLKADLRKYQVEGYRWLRRMSELGVGACLADDMGLGKTVQALAVLLDRAKSGPTLVVAPASVGFNWKEEVGRFTTKLKPIVYADGRRNKSITRLKGGDVLIISYALVLKDIEKLKQIRWGTLILDEAQFIKNALSQTAIAVSQLDREWTLALTGTPLENHLGELWSIFRMLNPELLGTWEFFRKNYVVPIEKARDPNKLENLRRLIRPFILRRTKSNVLEDLPERSDIVLKVELGDAQRAKYESERNRILSQLDEVDEKIRFKLLAAITRLRQMACHPGLCEERYKGDSAKLTIFSELVEELVSENHRVLVFSQFTSFLSLISRELNRIHIPHVMMTGETPVKHRQAIIKRFQEGEVPIFLVSLRAGGTGLNLTHANYVIHMDPWWNPAVEEQATDRAHRIGQTQAVTVYRLVATNTIEEAILNIHTRKRDLVQSLLEGQESVGKLSIQDLVSLIKGGEFEEEETPPPKKRKK